MGLAVKSRVVLLSLLLGCVLPVLTARLAAGEETPAHTPEEAGAINALLAKLNAPDALAREDAERELLKFGLKALPQIKEAARAPEPETAARAKRLVSRLTATSVRPALSYAEVMPANSIFFLEAPHTRQTLDKLKDSPLGRFWELPATQKFYQGHHEDQVPNDQRILDAVRGLPKLLDGKALFALASPETAEAAELDPPLIYILESKQAAALEAQARRLFEGLTDPPKEPRRYGPFTVEAHITAQTVFGQESIIHSLTQKGIESFLDNLNKRPEKTLNPALKEIRALLPQYDFIYHLASAGFQELSDAGQLIDDEQVEVVDKLGFVAGSVCQGVVAATPDGFEEHLRIVLGGGDKNNGLLAAVRKTAGPAPRAEGAPQALDLIPDQAGLLLSFHGDAARNGAALAAALRALDAKETPVPAPPRPQPGAGPGAAKLAPPAPPAPPGKAAAKTLGQEALAAAGAGQAGGKAPGDGKAPPPKAKPVVTYPRVERFEKMGLKLDQFLEQVDGPVHVALFLQQVEEDLPDDLPVSLLAAFAVKDAKAMTAALDAACGGAAPRFTKENLGGGAHYVEKDGDADARPGFWLKDNYLAYASERDLLELAHAALLHKGGNERLADRQSYKAQKPLEPQALFSIFGDADQVMDMPYHLAKLNWQENDKNPWPAYDLVRGLLRGKPVLVRFQATPEGIQGYARTPLTLFGMIEVFRRSFIEAGFW